MVTTTLTQSFKGETNSWQSLCPLGWQLTCICHWTASGDAGLGLNGQYTVTSCFICGLHKKLLLVSDTSSVEAVRISLNYGLQLQNSPLLFSLSAENYKLKTSLIRKLYSAKSFQSNQSVTADTIGAFDPTFNHRYVHLSVQTIRTSSGACIVFMMLSKLARCFHG